MKVVIREWLKCKKAIFIMLVTIAVAGIKAWTVVQCSLYIPRAVASGSATSPDMQWLIFVSILAVIMDSIYVMMESKSYRIFFTTTCNRFMRNIVDAEYELYTKYSLAYITHVQGFIQDASSVGKFVIRISSNIIHMCLNIGAIILLAPPRLILTISVMYLIMALCIWPFYKIIGKHDQKARDKMKERDQVVENAVYGFTEVRLNNTQDNEYRRVSRYNTDIYQELNIKNRFNAILMFGASGMDGAGTIVAALMVLTCIINGTMTAATGVSVIIMAGNLLGGLMNILDMVDSASEITSRSQKWEDFMKDASKRSHNGEIKMAPLHQRISVSNVDFSYGDTGSVLEDCKLDIIAGTKIGICGRSGDGKSTLLKLLCDFYQPDKGSIKFDGVDLRDIERHSLYDQMAVVSQDIMIFPGTILENITYGRPDVTEHAVIEACKKADLYDFVMKFPNQLQTEVGPRGIKLSGGQRQRVALARMFLKNPSIIILDEATSALDNASEKLIQRAIEEMTGKTIIMVAHRLTTIDNCDTIFVMENGHIVEEGSPKELKEIDGYYAAMLKAGTEA